MKKTYNLTGMTCGSCEAKVKTSLLTVSGITHVEASKDNNQVVIDVQRNITQKELQSVLDSKYQLREHKYSNTETKNWFNIYKPVILIFIYITIITLCIEYYLETFVFKRWCRHFMSGFFLIFSFFKMLNLKGFSNSYQMYDVIAKRFPIWGTIYAFLELILGISFLLNIFPLVTNSITLLIMTISIIGVLQTVLNKKKIQCACLGDVFNLPMSTVTIIEDGLMIVMSFIMLVSNVK